MPPTADGATLWTQEPFTRPAVNNNSSQCYWHLKVPDITSLSFINSFTPVCTLGAVIIIPILQFRKLRHRNISKCLGLLGRYS